MNLEEKLSLLKEKVAEAFNDVPHPKGVLAPHECDKCFELRKAFENKDWKTIDKKIIEEKYSQMPLLSAEAFHYFLPAYLIYSLENFNDNSVCQFTIYELNPRKKILKEMFDYWKGRYQNFTDEQMEVIYEFLDLFNENKSLYFEFYEDANVEILKSVRDQQN